mmetsp:Transcript_81132/g.224536  ORF Transcript_81132/g.224536 Transcript_81132/m.224536 type:complete len:213 (-) Transcript_81132:357-995(-)
MADRHQVGVEDPRGVRVTDPRATRFVPGAGPRMPKPVCRHGVRVSVGTLLDGDAMHLSGVEVRSAFAARLAPRRVGGIRHGPRARVQGVRGGADVAPVCRDQRTGAAGADLVVHPPPELGHVRALGKRRCAVEPEAVHRPVLGQHLAHHANLPLDELRPRSLRDPCLVPIVLHVQVVTDLDAPAVRSIRKLTEDITLPIPPETPSHGVVGKL